MSNKVKKFFFDIDDTLYNQYEPFRRAFEYSFGDRFKALNVERIFIDSRARSDEVFDMVSRGEIDKEEMYAYRIGKAFEDNGAYLSKSDCLAFQDNYETFQGKICLSEQIQNLLTYLSKQGVFLGIISNGPERHQWFKIKTLGLEKWFPKENIFISGKIGLTKPHREIFQYVEKRTNVCTLAMLIRSTWWGQKERTGNQYGSIDATTFSRTIVSTRLILSSNRN